jgi:hypothetical protein
MCNCIGSNCIGQLCSVALLPLFRLDMNKGPYLDMCRNYCSIRAPVRIVYVYCIAYLESIQIVNKMSISFVVCRIVVY